MRWKLAAFSIGAVVSVCASTLAAADRLVPSVYPTIQAAIDAAVDGDNIIVAPGLYLENIDILGKNVILTGTNPTDVSVVATTIIDGNDVNSVVTFSGTEGTACTLTGFTITNGYAIEGGGIRGNGTRAAIKNNIIHHNVVQKIGPLEPQSYGGGLYKCDGLIEENIITDNIAEYMGHGGAMYDCDGTIRSNIISHNSAIIGGALTGCDGTIGNNLLIGNAGLEGGAFYACNGAINSCTVVGNKWLGLGSCAASIKNCIVWHNGNGQEANQLYDCNVPVYSCIEDWDGGGIGNIALDPCFVTMGYWLLEEISWVWVDNGGDYHLKSEAGRWDPNSESWVIDSNTSLCIDAGNPGCPVGDEPDPNGNRINMGAYGGTTEASKSPDNWAFLADLTNDRKVDYNDVAAFVGYWLESGQCLPGDLDRSQLVDAVDFALFASEWSQTPAEPGMTYEIGTCEFEATSSSTGEPNFSVWVEGRYIHFEDMMYANCCPDELRLEKQIIGNQITLYEIGYDGFCYCMCWFPITATLGPFPDGTYTVEVIDNLGQSLGVVEVTVGEPPEPGISYQIEDCNPEAGASSVAEQSESTRFTVTVEAQYIHFEDMMVANCCPDELLLEMTVQDNLITIFEIEYTSFPCTCICDFPVTATLGPFAPGTYTLEVYEDWGGFIGTTTVTIGS